MDKMRFAVYARYSSSLQKPTSNKDQIAGCRRCEKALSGTVLEDYVFTDDEISGGLPMDRRPGLAALLRAAEQIPRPFEYLLVDDTSRLSRNEGETSNIIKSLAYYGIHVFFVSQGIDTARDQSHLTVGVHGVFDAHYRREVALKTLRGMRGATRRGYNTGGRVYGYKYIPELDPSGAIDRKTGQPRVLGKRPVVDEEQAAVVQEIFLFAAEGWSPRQIAARLNQKGLAPVQSERQCRNGCQKPSWQGSTIRVILQNPKYIGDWTFNKGGWITHPDRGQRKYISKPKSEWEPLELEDCRIIDLDTWHAVQENVRQRKLGPRRKSRRRSNYLLTGLMRCHECGGSYVVSSGSKPDDPLFQCARTRERGSAVCSNYFKVRKSEIEQVILRDIQKQLLSPPVLSAIVGKVNEKITSKMSELRQRSTNVVEEYNELQEQIRNVVKHIAQYGPSDTLQAELQKLETRLREAQRHVEALDKAHNTETFKVDQRYVESWLLRIRELMETDVEAANKRLESLIGEFTLSPEIISGVRYLRVRGKAHVEGLLAMVAGKKGALPIAEYRPPGICLIALPSHQPQP